MKLSELVNYRNELNQLSVSKIQQESNIKLDVVTHLVHSKPVQIENFGQQLDQCKLAINDSFTVFDQAVNSLKEKLNQTIEAEGQYWFQESYRLYEQEEMQYTTVEQILDRQMNVSTATVATFQSRIRMYGNWKYPAMIIRPGREKFIDDMVMFDPLYLIDSDHELLKPAIEKFPEDYQKRLRTYVIDELKNDYLLQQIPDNQFGLCLAFNLFNFRPLEVIRRYLTEIYQKLKPGGVVLLTFNDCDRDKAVMLVEQHFASYTPGTLIQELALSIGYEPIFKWDDGGPSTWLEIKKPGELTSLRGGQSLAKIVHKSVAESK